MSNVSNHKSYSLPPPFVITNNNSQPPLHSTLAPEHVYARERPIPLSFCETSQKYKPQSNSIAGGIILLCISGMHIGWALWRVIFWTNSWIVGISNDVRMFIMCSWFIGAVIGSFVGAVLIDLYRKKIIYYLGGVVYLLSSLLFIIWYNEYLAILSGRILAGFGHGIIYAAVITHAAENSIKQMRGIILSSINYMITFGIFAATICMSSFDSTLYNSINSDMLIGIISIIFSIIGLLSTRFFNYESIVYLLRNGCDREALTNMLKLRNESIETQQIHRDMLEIRLMINEDKLLTKNIFAEGNLKPILFMLLLRIQYIATNNFGINILMIMFMEISLSSTDNIFDILRYSPLVLIGARMIAGVVSLFSVYFWPRKLHLLVSQICCISTMIAFATLVLVQLEFPLTSGVAYYVPGIFAVLYQIFAAIGIDPMSHVFLSEAFASPKSAWSITIVAIIEYFIQLLLVCLFFHAYFVAGTLSAGILHFFTYFSAAVIIFCTIILYAVLPETRELSLKEAKDRFAQRHFRGTVLPGITYS